MRIKELRHLLGLFRNQIVKVFNIFPVQDAIIFESNPDFNDEGYWMCKKFFDEGMDKKYKIYWYLKDRHAIGKPDNWDVDYIYLHPRSIKEWIKKYYVLHTSRVILDSCQFVNKSRPEQFRFFLHHGCMPVKRIDKYMSIIGDYDYISIGSSHFKRYYESIGVPCEKMVSLGMARNDQLNNNAGCLQKLVDLKEIKSVVMWMPTYRQHVFSKEACNSPVDLSNKTGMPVFRSNESFGRLNDQLQANGTMLLLKLHPSQNLSFLEVKDYSNIKVITNKMLELKKIQLYSLMAEIDALITDYSSIYYDYLLVQKPIALTVDDIEMYRQNVGFIHDNYMEEIKGYYVTNEDEFFDFIENFQNSSLEDIRQCRNSYHDIIDFSSADKLFGFIKEKANL